MTGPDGNLWFGETSNYYGAQVGKMTTAGAVTQYPLPALLFNATIAGMAVGPDGAIWFSEYGTNAVGRITTAGVMTQHATGGSGTNYYPYGIAAGPNSSLWFTDPNTPGVVGYFSL